MSEIIPGSGKTKAIFLMLIFLIITCKMFSQENPPIPIKVSVNTSQYLNFGSFTTGYSGGTVTVDHTGARTKTGDIVLLHFGETESSALFEVKANPGTIISIMHNSNIPLLGTNGGEIYLNLNSYSTGKTFITTASPPATNPVYIGGTISVGSDETPGYYNGQIFITFIQQ